MENVFIQILIAIAGGFALNLLWDLYEKKGKKKLIFLTGSVRKVIDKNRKVHPILYKGIRYIICFFVMFFALDLGIDMMRAKNKMDKDWITFEWVIFEENNLGNHFISANYEWLLLGTL